MATINLTQDEADVLRTVLEWHYGNSDSELVKSLNDKLDNAIAEEKKNGAHNN